MANQYVVLKRTDNQARGIGQYAIDFVRGTIGAPDESVESRVEQFHLDSIGCAIAALAGNMNAPRLLRAEALSSRVAGNAPSASVFGSFARVSPEKAVVANSSAVRELDANGTNFGYNRRTGQCRGEFGHNDFYPVVIAAAEQRGLNGAQALRAMIALDEIRGRLAESFGLKDHKIDHVVHGAIASAAIYAAMLEANVDQIESAIGLLVAHYIPFRAIRAGHQLSDSKGASAAISAEAAVLCAQRAMRGFVGPADIFRNPQAIFCLFEPPGDAHSSPFDLELAAAGDDFAVMGMHFKLGLYEHQSAGAIQGLIHLLGAHPEILAAPDRIRKIRITIYEPAFSIIGDPAKRNPTTRQSADHSMVYIIGTLLRKAVETKTCGWDPLMLLPADYDEAALFHPLTRQLMERIDFQHGGAEFDRQYPEGIPTRIEIEHETVGTVDSGLVLFPEGHARSANADLQELLELKFRRLVAPSGSDSRALLARFKSLRHLTPPELKSLYASVPVVEPTGFRRSSGH